MVRPDDAEAHDVLASRADGPCARLSGSRLKESVVARDEEGAVVRVDAEAVDVACGGRGVAPEVAYAFRPTVFTGEEEDGHEHGRDGYEDQYRGR